jgi:hypothetical protein
MSAKAIEKLQSEMTKNNTNSYIQAVGEFLLQHLESNPQDADKILTTDKAIGKSLDEMRKVAAKKKDGNCAVLTDQEGFAIVMQYFGIKGAPVVMAAPTAAPISVPTLEKPTPSFDVRLEDLL